jgi:hypothetical protein
MKTLKSNFKKKVIPFFAIKVKLTLLSSCIAIMTLTSCGADDDSIAADCGIGLWTLSVQSELNNWLTASQAYAQDPTPMKCQNNKAAGQAYINALEGIKACVPNLGLADFEQALEEAKVEINAISCN